MKRVCLILILLIFMPCIKVCAESQAFDGEVYREQYENSGAEKLFSELPAEVKKSFDGIGVNGADFNKIMEINPESVLQNILSTAQKKLPKPVKCISMVLAVILLSAIFSALKISINEKSLTLVLDIVTALCICMIVVAPIVDFVGRVATIIKGSTTFLLCYIPIMVGIMVAAGQTFSSVAFSSLMVTLGNVITQLSSGFLVPLLSVFLVLSIVSAISPRFKFSGLCELFSKVIKVVLGFVMTIFSGILTTKSLIGATVDSVNSKTVKFVLSSFVPIVGSALGDAFLTVQGCVKILKSGVGAFFIIAIGFIFLPAIVECIIWTFTMSICASAGEIFELSSVTALLKNVGKVVSTLLAVVLCIMTILIISTVVVLNIGGGSG